MGVDPPVRVCRIPWNLRSGGAPVVEFYGRLRGDRKEETLSSSGITEFIRHLRPPIDTVETLQ